MFNNFSSILNNLDSIAQENLQEGPKVSATSLRQQKKESVSTSLENSVPGAVPLSNASSNNSEASFVVLDQHDSQSENAASPKSTLSASSIECSSLAEKTSRRESKLSTKLDQDLHQQIIEKDKEIEKLNSECLELESQNESLKEEIREAWDAYKSSQEKAALREASYQEDMSQLERAKSSDREGMATHVKSMECELEDNRAQLKSIQEKYDQLSFSYNSLQEEAKEWKAKKSGLEEALEEAQANSNHNLQGLRDDIRNKDKYIETLQAEHSSVMHRAHQQYDALEKSNADLSSTLIMKDRELNRLALQLQQGNSGQEIVFQNELTEVRAQLDQAESSLQEERELRKSCQRKLKSVEHEAEVSKSAWEDEKAMLLSRIGELVESADSNSAKCASGIQEEDQSQEINRLEEQLKTLGQQLLRKQESLEEYLSERAALKVRLQDAQKRSKKYEDQVASLLESYVDPYDYESGGGVRRNDSGVLRKRGASGVHGGHDNGSGRSFRATQDLEKLGVHAGPGVTRAVDMLDTWTLVFGRFLKTYPLLRISFLLYLLFIHFWVFVVIAYHTHALDLDNESAGAMTNNKINN